LEGHGALGHTINEDEYKMLQFADTVDEAFDHIRAGLEKLPYGVDAFLQGLLLPD